MSVFVFELTESFSFFWLLLFFDSVSSEGNFFLEFLWNRLTTTSPSSFSDSLLLDSLASSVSSRRCNSRLSLLNPSASALKTVEQIVVFTPFSFSLMHCFDSLKSTSSSFTSLAKTSLAFIWIEKISGFNMAFESPPEKG